MAFQPRNSQLLLLDLIHRRALGLQQGPGPVLHLPPAVRLIISPLLIQSSGALRAGCTCVTGMARTLTAVAGCRCCSQSVGSPIRAESAHGITQAVAGDQELSGSSHSPRLGVEERRPGLRGDVHQQRCAEVGGFMPGEALARDGSCKGSAPGSDSTGSGGESGWDYPGHSTALLASRSCHKRLLDGTSSRVGGGFVSLFVALHAHVPLDLALAVYLRGRLWLG